MLLGLWSGDIQGADITVQVTTCCCGLAWGRQDQDELTSVHCILWLEADLCTCSCDAWYAHNMPLIMPFNELVGHRDTVCLHMVGLGGVCSPPPLLP